MATASTPKGVTLSSDDFRLIFAGLEMLAKSRERAAKAESDKEVAEMFERRVHAVNALITRLHNEELSL